MILYLRLRITAAAVINRPFPTKMKQFPEGMVLQMFRKDLNLSMAMVTVLSLKKPGRRYGCLRKDCRKKCNDK